MVQRPFVMIVDGLASKHLVLFSSPAIVCREASFAVGSFELARQPEVVMMGQRPLCSLSSVELAFTKEHR
jgi:hypothetical protein